MCCTLHAVTQINSVQLNVRQEPVHWLQACGAMHITRPSRLSLIGGDKFGDRRKACTLGCLPREILNSSSHAPEARDPPTACRQLSHLFRHGKGRSGHDGCRDA